jgi:hypothetical protein
MWNVKSLRPGVLTTVVRELARYVLDCVDGTRKALNNEEIKSK